MFVQQQLFTGSTEFLFFCYLQGPSECTTTSSTMNTSATESTSTWTPHSGRLSQTSPSGWAEKVSWPPQHPPTFRKVFSDHIIIIRYAIASTCIIIIIIIIIISLFVEPFSKHSYKVLHIASEERKKHSIEINRIKTWITWNQGRRCDKSTF